MTALDLICRLCKSTEFLISLYEIDGDTSLLVKTTQCTDIKIYPEDGLPTVICKKCKRKIKKFYDFKQKCLEVDLELKTMMHSVELDSDNNGIQLNIECTPDKDGKDVYLSDNSKDDLKVFDSQLCISVQDNCLNKLKEDEKSHISVQCELCGSMFNTKTEFRRHFSSHGETKLFQCKFCPKRFTRSESNVIHMRTHLGIRPFICEICGQSSTKRQDLVRHMKIHSDQKNHECPTCGRRFKRSGDLCTHIRTHSGMRPYKCMLCEKDYTSHSGLRKHYKTHYNKESNVKL